MSAHEHRQFFQHYATLLQEDHSRSRLPMDIEAFEHTLKSRCPYLSETDRANILACLEKEVTHRT